MGFTIDMISGEIQSDSTLNQNPRNTKDYPSPEMLDTYLPLPQIQEYRIENTTRQIPGSVLHIDIDAFVDNM